MIRKISFFIVFMFIVFGSLSAEEIHLKNGDRISGEIINETESVIMVETKALGQISIEKEFIAEEKGEEKEADAAQEDLISWERNASLGYSQTSGNTDDSQGSAELSIHRKTQRDEWTGKINMFLSTSNDKMDAKKFKGLGRYAYSFGEEMKWYNFYKFEGDQNRFANIDYRLIPSTGVGYWISDNEDWKALLEGAIGFEHTNYRDSTKSDNEAILIPRGFLEMKLVGDLRISEDIVLYPSLTKSGEYRLHSETVLINPISDKVAWKMSFIDDYNSNPSGSTKRNDFRLISSLDYAF